MQWLRRMNALLELLFQSMLSLRRQIRFVGFLAGELRQDRQFILQIFPGNTVPKSVFKREDVHLLLLDAENLRRRKLNNDFIGANVDGQALPQIEAGFDRKRSMELDAFGASGPRMRQLVLNLDLL